MPARNEYRLIVARNLKNQRIVNECLRLSVLLMLADEQGYASADAAWDAQPPHVVWANQEYRTKSPEGRSWGYYFAAKAYAQIGYEIDQVNRPDIGTDPVVVLAAHAREGQRVKFLNVENHKCLDEFFANGSFREADILANYLQEHGHAGYAELP
jgi:hypothetical protein